MGQAQFYDMFAGNDLQEKRIEELLLWSHQVRQQPTDKAIDIAISNLIISYLKYPSLTDVESVNGAMTANFVLIADAYNKAINGEDSWDDAMNNNVLFQYQMAYSEGENIVSKLLNSPSLTTLMDEFGKQPLMTGETNAKIPMMWNAYILLASLMKSFYKNAELERFDLATREPGWSEASLQTLGDNSVIQKLFHPKRKTVARAIGDASEYFPFAACLCGTIMTIRAIKYPDMSLSECSSKIEITLDDIRDNIALILASAAWFEKHLIALFSEPTIHKKAKRGGEIIETKKIKSQSLTKLFSNKGYVCIMPLGQSFIYKLPWDSMAPVERLLKDFEFINDDNDKVKVGRRDYKSRPAKDESKAD